MEQNPQEIKNPYCFPLKQFRDTLEKNKQLNTGFLDNVSHFILAFANLASIHHILQSIFWKSRYWITDFYCLAWLIFGILTCFCFFYPYCFCVKQFFPSLIVFLMFYRLAEIILRELWVLLYREIKHTPSSRVLLIALLNYVNVILFFGFLYDQGQTGFKKAVEIGLTFYSTDSGIFFVMGLIQSIYCIVFIFIVIAAFIGRITTQYSAGKSEL